VTDFQLTPPEIGEKWNTVHFSAEHDHWSTPAELYADLDREFSFTLDPCPLKGAEGLTRSWKGERIYCNPPYSKIDPWLEKANEADLAVFLLPSRTDTDWFHRFAPRAEVRFLRGRLKFRTAQMNAPFGSVILIFRQAHK
jgi:hypothetical protein